MIDYDVRDGVAELRFNNGPVNAITEPFLDALLAALDRARQDDTVRTVILASAIPGRFCAGLDLPAFLRGTPADAHRMVGKIYVRISEAQSALGKPSIAAVGGAARGAGMSIAITCDMILAAEHATFGYPEIDVGLLPAIHFHHLPRIVGRHRAFDLLFTGRSFDAAEAVSLGLVNRQVPAERLMEEARATAGVLAAKSPALMRLGKAAFLRAAAAGYREGAESAVDLVSAVFGTEDCREGLTAFAEKRRPAWTGR
ncbi:enoyl-CoA hydratase/isomerase family protein [Paracraurococcus ruber]|uniref:Enoyl-CoA hydratase n=1 Tax=Paracraurococcus ruber TaxID=77675 RepID=A0ABS1D4L3_9PROT|nr:enoyl-CoA hydratase/isomerase family protein [Paracraurococcus ruber]MBK1660799.1 enoyl-CoA hydratase [Paracraurococcus ruber]TDG30294.1 enoyl-CoA hydratase/isomerase family protein [Paracraurococcus ruber]